MDKSMYQCNVSKVSFMDELSENSQDNYNRYRMKNTANMDNSYNQVNPNYYAQNVNYQRQHMYNYNYPYEYVNMQQPNMSVQYASQSTNRPMEIPADKSRLDVNHHHRVELSQTPNKITTPKGYIESYPYPKYCQLPRSDNNYQTNAMYNHNTDPNATIYSNVPSYQQQSQSYSQFPPQYFNNVQQPYYDQMSNSSSAHRQNLNNMPVINQQIYNYEARLHYLSQQNPKNSTIIQEFNDAKEKLIYFKQMKEKIMASVPATATSAPKDMNSVYNKPDNLQTATATSRNNLDNYNYYNNTNPNNQMFYQNSKMMNNNNTNNNPSNSYDNRPDFQQNKPQIPLQNPQINTAVSSQQSNISTTKPSQITQNSTNNTFPQYSSNFTSFVSELIGDDDINSINPLTHSQISNVQTIPNNTNSNRDELSTPPIAELSKVSPIKTIPSNSLPAKPTTINSNISSFHQELTSTSVISHKADASDKPLQTNAITKTEDDIHIKVDIKQSMDSLIPDLKPPPIESHEEVKPTESIIDETLLTREKSSQEMMQNDKTKNEIHHTQHNMNIEEITIDIKSELANEEKDEKPKLLETPGNNVEFNDAKFNEECITGDSSDNFAGKSENNEEKCASHVKINENKNEEENDNQQIVSSTESNKSLNTDNQFYERRKIITLLRKTLKDQLITKWYYHIKKHYFHISVNNCLRNYSNSKILIHKKIRQNAKITPQIPAYTITEDTGVKEAKVVLLDASNTIDDIISETLESANKYNKPTTPNKKPQKVKEKDKDVRPPIICQKPRGRRKKTVEKFLKRKSSSRRGSYFNSDSEDVNVPRKNLRSITKLQVKTRTKTKLQTDNSINTRVSLAENDLFDGSSMSSSLSSNDEDEDGSGKQKSMLNLSVNPNSVKIVQKILGSRMIESNTDSANEIANILNPVTQPSNEIEEYYLKYKGYSYIHCEWKSANDIKDPLFQSKLKRYKNKHPNNPNDEVEDCFFNPDYVEIDRVLDIQEIEISKSDDVKSDKKDVDDEENEEEKTDGDNNKQDVNEDVKEIETFYLVKWRTLPYEEITWEKAENVDPCKVKLYQQRNANAYSPKIEIPTPTHSDWSPITNGRGYKNDNKLRDYQLEGVNWLTFCWITNRNCILADEMGLGKTIQSIAFLVELSHYQFKGPFLVIVPLSTLGNWQREFENWSDFYTIVYHGSGYSRSIIQNYDTYHSESNNKLVFNVIITTYEVLLTDLMFFSQFQWRAAIIDEAHRLKNKRCKLFEGLKMLDIKFRVLLTGTPLQNNVQELFNLLNFLEPTKFFSEEDFLSKFGNLKSEEQINNLKRLLRPMMLRRLKEDVEKSLAPKEEIVVEVELTNIQKKYYRAILERNFSFLSHGTSGNNVPNLMNTMMELRKCCNHPFLVKGAEDNIMDSLKNGSDMATSIMKFINPSSSSSSSSGDDNLINNIKNVDEETLQFFSMVYASGKLVFVHKLLPKLKQNGHKVLIFSQMVRVLDILEDYLIYEKYQYERIDGRIHGLLRQEAIDRFTTDQEKFVFLLCTKAGGLGINLTAADVVIIYDSDWNPQNDLQAQARCHRIGQQKLVNVYRLITRNTYEREMFDRASMKLGLDKAILQSMSCTPESKSTSQLTKKEIEDLLKLGAYGAIMDDDKDGEKFCEEDIDKILNSRSTVVRLSNSERNSSFSKASFTISDNRSDIDLDDPNFWQKWAKKAGVDDVDLCNTLIMDKPRLRRQTNRYKPHSAIFDEISGEESNASSAAQESLVKNASKSNLNNGNNNSNNNNLNTNLTNTNLNKKKTSSTSAEFDSSNIDQSDDVSSKDNMDRNDLFKAEKCLLQFGWGRWEHALLKLCFKSSSITAGKDLEHLCRVILHYAHKHYCGDDRIYSFIEELLHPDSDTRSMRQHLGYSAPVARGRRGRKGAEDKEESMPAPGPKKLGKCSASSSALDESAGNSVSIVPANNGDEEQSEVFTNISTPLSGNGDNGDAAAGDTDFSILICSNFRKHIQRTSHKLLHRIQFLFFLNHEIIGQERGQLILDDCHYTTIAGWPELKLFTFLDNEHLPSWWNSTVDKCLLLGIYKHGWERFDEIFKDSSLGLSDWLAGNSLPNEADNDLQINKDPKVEKPSDSALQTPNEDPEIDAEETINNQNTEKSAQRDDFPTNSELNIRLRKIIGAFQKLWRQKESDKTKIKSSMACSEVNVTQEIVMSDGKTLKWSRREETEFYRALNSFGVEKEPNTDRLLWTNFRNVCNLPRKTDDSLTEYFKAFYTMCQRICQKSHIVYDYPHSLEIESISQERASRCLLKVNLLTKIRNEMLCNPHLEERIQLCESTNDFPVWWVPGYHDISLLRGIVKYGATRTELSLINDPSLKFRDTIKQILRDFWKPVLISQYINQSRQLPLATDLSTKKEPLCDGDTAIKQEDMPEMDPQTPSSKLPKITDNSDDVKPTLTDEISTAPPNLEKMEVSNEEEEEEDGQDDEERRANSKQISQRKKDEQSEDDSNTAPPPIIREETEQTNNDQSDLPDAIVPSDQNEESKDVESKDVEKKEIDMLNKCYEKLSDDIYGNTIDEAVDISLDEIWRKLSEELEFKVESHINDVSILTKIGWPKERALFSRLELIVQTIEKGEWPFSTRSSIVATPISTTTNTNNDICGGGGTVGSHGNMVSMHQQEMMADASYDESMFNMSHQSIKMEADDSTSISKQQQMTTNKKRGRKRTVTQYLAGTSTLTTNMANNMNPGSSGTQLDNSDLLTNEMAAAAVFSESILGALISQQQQQQQQSQHQQQQQMKEEDMRAAYEAWNTAMMSALITSAGLQQQQQQQQAVSSVNTNDQNLMMQKLLMQMTSGAMYPNSTNSSNQLTLDSLYGAGLSSSASLPTSSQSQCFSSSSIPAFTKTSSSTSDSVPISTAPSTSNNTNNTSKSPSKTSSNTKNTYPSNNNSADQLSVAMATLAAQSMLLDSSSSNATPSYSNSNNNNNSDLKSLLTSMNNSSSAASNDALATEYSKLLLMMMQQNSSAAPSTLMDPTPQKCTTDTVKNTNSNKNNSASITNNNGNVASVSQISSNSLSSSSSSGVRRGRRPKNASIYEKYVPHQSNSNKSRHHSNYSSNQNTESTQLPSSIPMGHDINISSTNNSTSNNNVNTSGNTASTSGSNASSSSKDTLVPVININDGSLIYDSNAPRRKDLHRYLLMNPNYMPYSIEEEDQLIFNEVAKTRGQDTGPLYSLLFGQYVNFMLGSLMPPPNQSTPASSSSVPPSITQPPVASSSSNTSSAAPPGIDKSLQDLSQLDSSTQAAYMQYLMMLASSSNENPSTSHNKPANEKPNPATTTTTSNNNNDMSELNTAAYQAYLYSAMMYSELMSGNNNNSNPAPTSILHSALAAPPVLQQPPQPSKSTKQPSNSASSSTILTSTPTTTTTKKRVSSFSMESITDCSSTVNNESALDLSRH